MAKKSNIVFQYFKKEEKDHTIFIQYDPIQSKGATLTINSDGEMELEEVEFEGDVVEQLKADGYKEANALEYHILINGLN